MSDALFDDRLFDVGLGQAQRDAAIKQVAEAADEAWTAAATKTVITLAKRLEFFTTDEVWAALPADVTTHEPRAMGAVMRDMAKRRIIIPTDRTVESKRPDCHRRPVRVWRSLL